MGEMDARDPQQWVNEPLRGALDAVLYRWLLLFCAPVAAAVIHKAGPAWAADAVHWALPALLVAYIGVHVVGRHWRHRGLPGGWMCADQADHGTVTVTRSIGWVALVGSGLAIVAPLGSLSEPRAFLMDVLLWFPVLFPLYCLAVWVTLDCAEHRLGRAVEESRHRMRQYWHGISGGRASPSV